MIQSSFDDFGVAAGPKERSRVRNVFWSAGEALHDQHVFFAERLDSKVGFMEHLNQSIPVVVWKNMREGREMWIHPICRKIQFA